MIARSETGTVKGQSFHTDSGGFEKSLFGTVLYLEKPKRFGDTSSDPSTLLSPCIYTAPADILVADGDPTVGRAVADPIGRLGRVALPPVCAVGDGPDVIPLSAILHSEEVCP